MNAKVANRFVQFAKKCGFLNDINYRWGQWRSLAESNRSLHRERMASSAGYA
jgi:hypothetical protein